VVLAKWLATEPKLLILDSPTVGVDVGARAGIFRIVRELAAEGLAILLISDEAPEVYHNADRVLRMAGGRIAGEYDPRRIGLADWRRRSMARFLRDHPTEARLALVLLLICAALSWRRTASSRR
jgi:simple sugar transport system ATP-binding protein